MTLWMFLLDMLISLIVNSLEPTPKTYDFWSKARVVMELP
jgi:hypothetical protein